MAGRWILLCVAGALVLTGCQDGPRQATPPVLLGSEGRELGPAPDPPDGPLDPELRTALDGLRRGLVVAIQTGATLTEDVYRRVGAGGDARVGWLLSDLVRLAPPDTARPLAATFEELTGAAPDPEDVWRSMTDLLIAWDLPAYPGYREDKAVLFTLVEPGWAPFFEDAAAAIDWRLVSWGGVFIDDRPLGDTRPCPRGCIPALDDPLVTGAAEGGWYPDDRLVFGVVVGDEARAYPKNQMEVHEMVNDRLGGRRIALPYCTLCGSAQLYFLDDLPDGLAPPVLRTSGLLSRSNKVMYDLTSGSVFDTFTGEALSGPLRAAGVVLTQGTVVTSTWADWKAAHPETTIVARDGGLGRDYPLDPLRGRDDDGPIFPVGDVDPRLGVQDRVLGVLAPDGAPVAFPVVDLALALGAGRSVERAGVVVRAEAGGFVAETVAGELLASHEAFWFAWSQFMPDTELWREGG
jgi:Protein of unknown function (DUF3179)